MELHRAQRLHVINSGADRLTALMGNVNDRSLRLALIRGWIFANGGGVVSLVDPGNDAAFPPPLEGS